MVGGEVEGDEGEDLLGEEAYERGLDCHGRGSEGAMEDAALRRGLSRHKGGRRGVCGKSGVEVTI